MTEFEIINFNEKDSPVIKERLRHSLKVTKSRKNTEQCCLKLFGWVIDKKQRPVNIVAVAQGIKVFHELNLIQSAVASRMSEKLGATINERCGFSFKIEATEDFDLYLEVDHSLIPWKKIKIITTPVVMEADQQTELAIQQFKDINFLSAQASHISEFQSSQNQMDDSISLATDALFYFFSNQHNKIAAQHLNAVNALAIADVPFWNEVKKITYVEAVNNPVFKTFFQGDLALLISESKNENFAVSLVESAVTNNLSLASPFSTNRAFCQESYEIDGGFNCLRFTDGCQCFFLMQGLTSADGIYFPNENVLIAFDVVNEIHVKNLKKKLLNNFAKVIEYAKAENDFFGIIASHSRPYHFYYDIWPALVELSQKPDVVAHLPNVIMRTGHDFNHTDSILENSKCLVFDSAGINALALDEHKWFVHVGTRYALRNRYFYEHVDSALVNNAIASPSQIALEKIKPLEDCYPIVWIGVEGQKRCWLEQVDGYAYILNQLHDKYPKLGVVFDGWTLPITPSQGDLREVDKDQQIVNKIVRQIYSDIKFVSVVGETSRTKLAVGNKADFFICNFATGSMHISRLLGKPGFGHLSKRFSEIALRQAMHIHPNKNVYLLPQEYIVDDDKDIGHDWLSYSINKKAFYRFIVSKIEKVLGIDVVTDIKVFIEPPYSVNAELRQYLKIASHGNLIQIFPGKKLPNTIEDIANYSEAYLKKNVICDAFTYSRHKKIIGSGSYLVWLRDPLQRLYCHAAQFAKVAVNNKESTDRMLDVFSTGYITLDNHFTRMVSGVEVPFGKCTEAMLDKAIDNLKNDFIFIGFDERQRESFDLLCAVMDWDRSLFPNEIPNKFTVDDREFSEDIQSAAKALIVYDLRLYQAAADIFDDRLTRLKN